MGTRRAEERIWAVDQEVKQGCKFRVHFPLSIGTSVIKHKLSWGEGFRLCDKELPWRQHLWKDREEAKVGTRGCETEIHTQGHTAFINLTGVGLSAEEWPLSVDPGWSEGLAFLQCPLRGPGTAQDGLRYGLDGFLAQVARSGPW